MLEEKLVKRKVSLKALDYGKVEEAAGGTVRQTVTLTAGITSDKARAAQQVHQGLGLKGVQSQTQGEQLRVTGKKRDDLQAVIAALKGATSASRCSSRTSGTERPRRPRAKATSPADPAGKGWTRQRPAPRTRPPGTVAGGSAPAADGDDAAQS